MTRFKTDENLPNEAAELLREAGHDALTVLDQRMLGVPDSQIASVCLAEQRVIVTLDLDFSDIRSHPPAESAGIIVLRPARQDKASVLGLLRRLLPSLENETLSGKLWVVDESQIRVRD